MDAGTGDQVVHAVERAQQRALPAAGRADERGDLLSRDVHADPLDGPGAAVADRDVIEVKHDRRGRHRPRLLRRRLAHHGWGCDHCLRHPVVRLHPDARHGPMLVMAATSFAAGAHIIQPPLPMVPEAVARCLPRVHAAADSRHLRFLWSPPMTSPRGRIHVMRRSRLPRAFSVALGAMVVMAGLGSGPAAAAEASGEVKITGSSTVEPITSLVGENSRRGEPGRDDPRRRPGHRRRLRAVLQRRGATWTPDASRPIDEEEVDHLRTNGIEYTELRTSASTVSRRRRTRPARSSASTHDRPVRDLRPGVGGRRRESRRRPDAGDRARRAARRPKSGSVTEVHAGHRSRAPTTRSSSSATRTSWRSSLAAGSIPADKLGTNDDGEEEVIEPSHLQGHVPERQRHREACRGLVERASASSATPTYQANKGDLKDVAIEDNEDTGKCVKPTSKTIQNGTYPISRPLFVYSNNAKVTREATTKAYFDSYMTKKTLTQDVIDAGYVPWTSADSPVDDQRLQGDRHRLSSAPSIPTRAASRPTLLGAAALSPV